MTMKKAQVQSEVFLYILAAIIFSLIVLFGYKSIQTLITHANDVELRNFEIGLSNEVKNIATNLHTVRKKPVGIPSGYKEVCFVSSDWIGRSDFTLADHPVIESSVKNGVNKNTFLFPPGSMSFSVGTIEVDGGALCMPVTSGAISLRLEGMGNRTKVSKWSE